MKNKTYILILVVLFLNFQFAAGAENEYGIVKAWFNGKNATVTDEQLRIGEPAELKIEVISKINGNVYIKLIEPGNTKAFDVLNGPTKEDEWIDNIKIETGWSKTYIWTIIPNGAWKNGNAPINIFVEFSKIKTDKKVQFTIANPYILDEQYSGAVPTPVTTPSPAGTQVKETPFLSVMFTVGALMLAWRWREGKK
jgi:sarcinarray family protein